MDNSGKTLMAAATVGWGAWGSWLMGHIVEINQVLQGVVLLLSIATMAVALGRRK